MSGAVAGTLRQLLSRAGHALQSRRVARCAALMPPKKKEVDPDAPPKEKPPSKRKKAEVAEDTPEGAEKPKASRKKKSDAADDAAAAEEKMDMDWALKRPDPSEGAQVVVIHPGSTNLRIGLADASAPRVVPHCIAFRRFAARAAAAADNAAPKADALVKELEPTLGLLGRQLRLGQQLVGQIYEPVPPTVQKVGPGEMPPSADDEKGETTEGAFLVGNAAVKAALASPDEWDLIHPLKWCGLNTYEPYNKQGGEAPRSATAMLSAIAQIWKCAICGGGGEPGIGLTPASLSTACVVLAMPDLFDRRLGSQLLSILLEPSGLHFKAAILHEEAACAAFGAGGNAACVVDIGHERTSVCCVDEGMPMPGCRQILSYSCLDMDVLTHTLLHRQKLLKPVTNELPMLTTTAPSTSPRYRPPPLCARYGMTRAHCFSTTIRR